MVVAYLRLVDRLEVGRPDPEIGRVMTAEAF
jgi:hypothetical protein